MISNEEIRKVFSHLPLPVLLLEPRGSLLYIVDVNEAYLRLTGSTREQLLGKNNLEAFPKNPNISQQDYEKLQLSFEQVVKEAIPAKPGVIRFDLPLMKTESFEERYWLPENYPVVDANGVVTYIIHSVQDLTNEVLSKKRQHIDSLKQQQLNKFIEEHIDALFSLDSRGVFTSANARLSYISAVTVEELLKMSFHDFCAPHDRERMNEHFQKTLQGHAASFEAEFITARGEAIILDIALMPILVDQKIEGAYGIAKDVTGLRKTENIVIEKKKFLEINATFISSLLEKDSELDILEQAFEVIGKAVKVHRMCYFSAERDFQSNEILISKTAEWVSAGTSPQIQNPLLQNMPISKVEEIMAPLFQNKPFSAKFSELQEGELKKIFLEQDIQSMLLLPIFLKTELHGFIGFDDCNAERDWDEEEVRFLESLTLNLTNILEKRTAEAEVQESKSQLEKNEQKFRALVQEGADLMAILDVEGNYLFVSETSTGILGVRPAELVGKNVFNFIHPEDKNRIAHKFEQLKLEKQVRISPFRYLNAQGNWVWVETTATNLLDDPAVQGIVTNSRDITTIIKQAQEIEHINERYRLAAEASRDLIYDWDLENDEVNRYHNGPHKLFGYTEREVNTKKFWRTHIRPEEVEEVRGKLKTAIEDPSITYINSEYQFRRADGSYASVVDKGYIIRDKSGKAIRLIGATTDISDIKAKEEALEVANERFNMAMEATNEMIWDWNIEDNTITRGQAFEDVYGFSLEDDLPANEFWFSQTIEKDRERVSSSLEKAIQDKTQIRWKEEYQIKKANGRVAHVNDRAYIIRNKDGKATRMVGAVLDVTESRRLLREIQKQNKTLKEIAWEQSHVVRAPLARLKGLVYLLEIKAFDEMESKTIIENIKTSANELDDIIRRIVLRTDEIRIEKPKEG